MIANSFCKKKPKKIVKGRWIEYGEVGNIINIQAKVKGIERIVITINGIDICYMQGQNADIKIEIK
jgi:hypothetical protein